MKPEAWVTLATNDDYAIGALVLGQSLRNAKTGKNLHIIITSGVSDRIRKRLLRIFDDVSEVDPLNSRDYANLLMIKRPDLAVTFTKLHCWRLIQYSKCVFLDSDCLVLKNCDELFDYPELSAAPDVGWPDMFNTGVFVMTPSYDTYDALSRFAEKEGSFDGGDQGLLNDFFAGWRNLQECRLPFIYNTSSSISYTYVAAFRRFSKDIKIVHFLGQTKPWHFKYNVISGELMGMEGGYYHADHIKQWWSIFAEHIMPFLYDIRHVDIVGKHGAHEQRYPTPQESYQPYQQPYDHDHHQPPGPPPYETIQFKPEPTFHYQRQSSYQHYHYQQPEPTESYQHQHPPTHYQPPPQAAVTYNIEPMGYVYRPDLDNAATFHHRDYGYKVQEWTPTEHAIEPPQAEYTKQPWAPPELPFFIAAEPPAVDKSFRGTAGYGSSASASAVDHQILQPALAETARAIPEIFQEKPQETLELLRELSKSVPPELFNEPLLKTDYPSYVYGNRLTSCPVCNESLEYLDPFFPAVEEKEETVEPQKETKVEDQEIQEKVEDQFEYEDFEHKLAWEQGNIDYRGRDSWANIQQYLDQKWK